MWNDLYRQSKRLLLPGGAVCYLRTGQGPAVTLLHGIPLSLVTWRNNVASLSERATVIALDLRGFGRSDKPRGDYSPGAHARVLEQVLDVLGLHTTSLVGSSYGCAPALHFALSRPERVERLILINSVGYPAHQHSLERLLRMGLIAALMKTTLRVAPLGRSLFAARLRQCYARPEAVSDAEIDAYYALLRRDGGEASFLTTLRQFDEAELARLLPEITQQTLVIWGERDRVLPVHVGKRLHAALRHSQFEVLPDCGHLPHEEAPERVNALIKAFLQQDVSQPLRAARG
jgi:pimeloyl-ACP methyl ester carboxylesterase